MKQKRGAEMSSSIDTEGLKDQSIRKSWSGSSDLTDNEVVKDEPSDTQGEVPAYSSSSAKELIAPKISREILNVVEEHVIPRLVWGVQSDPIITNLGRDAIYMPSEDDVLAFADLAVNADVSSSLKFIRSLFDKGMAIESIYLDLIAPAAKYLGEMWVDDRVDFSRVSLGASCMQRSLLALSENSESEYNSTYQRSVLLSSMPGDQHMLGPSIAAEFLRRYGWHTQFVMPKSADDILVEIKNNEFDLLGLSLSCDDHLSDLDSLINRLKSDPSFKDIGIIVGGRGATIDPEHVMKAGSDVVALDARDAVLQAKDLFEKCHPNLVGSSPS